MLKQVTNYLRLLILPVLTPANINHWMEANMQFLLECYTETRMNLLSEITYTTLLSIIRLMNIRTYEQTVA